MGTEVGGCEEEDEAERAGEGGREEGRERERRGWRSALRSRR